MGKPRRFDVSPDNFIAGVSGVLTAPELGVYWAICLLIYSEGGPIDNDPERLKAFLRGTHLKTIHAAIARLEMLGKITLNGSEIMAKGCLKPIEDAVNRVQRASENGSKGGRPHSENKDLVKAPGYTSEKLPPPPPSPPPPSPPVKGKEVSCAGPTALALVDDPVLITFPTNRTGEVFEVRQSYFDQLAALYPGIADPAQQFRAMAAWLISNEKQRKTLGGMKRFINSWLSREQNRSGTNGRTQETRNGNWLAGAAALAAELRRNGDS